MLSDKQIDDASVFLAEVIMEAVYRQAKTQSRQMIVDFSSKEDVLPDESILMIEYVIAVPIKAVRIAIRRADG